jgi:hypothetical protein
LPNWLYIYLLVAYGLLFLGDLDAWWVPYLVLWPQPKRAAQYQAMYGNTCAFLPPRNGNSNQLHFILHAVTLATLLVLASYFRAYN